LTGSPLIDPGGLGRLRDAEARFRLGRFEASHDVIAAAVDLLVDGVDLSELAVLAGDDRADDRELERDLDRAMKALGLMPLSIDQAVIRLATVLANDVLAGRGDMKAAAQAVWDLWLAADHLDSLFGFAITADGFVDTPQYISVADLREAAADFLAQAPTG
jgi:hypothetical protein